MCPFASHKASTWLGVFELLNHLRREFERFIVRRGMCGLLARRSGWQQSINRTDAPTYCPKFTCIPYSEQLSTPKFDSGYHVKKTYLKALLFDEVSRRCGLTGFTLTQPIFWSDKPYQAARDLRSRRSRRVTPPTASDIHISRPPGGRSTDVMSSLSVANISLETPATKSKCRIVQS